MGDDNRPIYGPTLSAADFSFSAVLLTPRPPAVGHLTARKLVEQCRDSRLDKCTQQQKHVVTAIPVLVVLNLGLRD